MRKITLFLLLGIFMVSCTVVRPGQVGIKTRLGKVKGNTKTGGLMVFNPFIARVIKIPVRTINRELLINLPSKEGLTIQSEISILYRIKPEMAVKVYVEIGTGYDKVVTSVFRSAAADVCSKYFAKDMHSGMRLAIEKEILVKMNELLEDKGFLIEAVLLKSITLPAGLAKAIEDKLEAEQQAQRMEFILISEQKEAERKKIEAQGVRDAQLIIADGLTDKILQLRYIEAMEAYAKGNNSQIIITDGKTPVFMNPVGK